MPEVTIKEIAELRHKSTMYGVKALISVFVCTWTIYVTCRRIIDGDFTQAIFPAITSFAFGNLAMGYGTFWYLNFQKAWSGFYIRRCRSAVRRLLDEGYDFEQFRKGEMFSKWRFWRADDLKLFEESYLEYLRSYRRAEDMFKQQRKWERVNARLTQQLESILAEFHVPIEEQTEVLGRFSEFANPRRRREFLSGFCSRLLHRQWSENNQVFQQNGVPPLITDASVVSDVSEKDLRLKSLEIQASKVTNDTARHYYQRGLATTVRHDRIRLFGQALSEDVRAAEVETETSPKNDLSTATISETTLNEVKYISLQGFTRERLAVMQSLVNGADWKMCREIVLVLAEPGRSGGRFNKHYYAEDTVKRMVRRQCNNYADILFEPLVFEEAADWLLRRGVVVTKPKTDERTLSLSSHVKNTTTKEAGQIIKMILRVKREVKGLPS